MRREHTILVSSNLPKWIWWARWIIIDHYRPHWDGVHFHEAYRPNYILRRNWYPEAYVEFVPESVSKYVTQNTHLTWGMVVARAWSRMIATTREWSSLVADVIGSNHDGFQGERWWDGGPFPLRPMTVDDGGIRRHSRLDTSWFECSRTRAETVGGKL